MDVTRPNIPENIQRAGLLIRQLREKPFQTHAEQEAIRQAKLKIAFWACGRENVTPSRENLVYVLGMDAPEIMAVYDRGIKEAADRLAEREKKSPSGKKSGDGTSFWDGTKGKK